MKRQDKAVVSRSPDVGPLCPPTALERRSVSNNRVFPESRWARSPHPHDPRVCITSVLPPKPPPSPLPIDARKPDQLPDGISLLFRSFHHFHPIDRRNLMAWHADHQRPLLIIENTEPALKQYLGILLFSIPIALIAACKPQSLLPWLRTWFFSWIGEKPLRVRHRSYPHTHLVVIMAAPPAVARWVLRGSRRPLASAPCCMGERKRRVILQ